MILGESVSGVTEYFGDLLSGTLPNSNEGPEHEAARAANAKIVKIRFIVYVLSILVLFQRSLSLVDF